MNNQFDAQHGKALLGFNEEAVLYYRGISDMVVQEYARGYARMLADRARGMDFVMPRTAYGLFEPTRNLIRSTLDKMFVKYFPDV